MGLAASQPSFEGPAPTMLVTGASTGIGYALAVRYAKKGWAVYGSVRKEADGKALEAEGVRPVLFDVTDEPAMERAVARLTSELGSRGLNALVNNAGIVQYGPLELMTKEHWTKVFDVNVFGLAACTRLFLPLLRAAPESPGVGRRLVLVGSINGKITLKHQAVYAASKFALEGLADTLRPELLSQGIKVVLMEPGVIRTAIGGKVLEGLTNVQQQPLAKQPELQKLYDIEEMHTMMRVMGHEANAIPMEVLMCAFDKALTARRPSARYAVDGQNRAFLWLRSLLSDQWFGDAAFDWLAPRLLGSVLGSLQRKVDAHDRRMRAAEAGRKTD